MLQYAPMKFWPWGGLFGQVKSVVIKISFGKGSVTLQYITVCTHEILTGGGLFGQVKSVVIKLSYSKGDVMLRYAPMKFCWGIFLVNSNL